MVEKIFPKRVFSFVLITGAILSSCDFQIEEPELPQPGPTFINMKVPEGFPTPIFQESNPLTKEGVVLGRSLFYDPYISANGKVSCASCHSQHLAFSDGLALGNHGVSGNTLERHSPTLFNMAWMNNGFFWDGGSKNLESQAFGPLTHADEMGMSLQGLDAKISSNLDYVELFFEAYEDGPTVQNVAKALALFQKTLVSAGSRYDRYFRQEENVRLSSLELKGLELVRNNCSPCHAGELFTDNQFHNNGLDDDFSDLSHEKMFLGRYRITFRDEDMGAYKTPSLRNVAITAPYMHDGRFGSLEQVLDHYSDGVKDTPYTSRILYSKQPKPGISLTNDDKIAVIAFLKTLTDLEFIENPEFSRPYE